MRPKRIEAALVGLDDTTLTEKPNTMILELQASAKSDGYFAECWCNVRASTEAEAQASIWNFLAATKGDRKVLLRAAPTVSSHKDFVTDLTYWEGFVRFARVENEAGGIIKADDVPVRYLPLSNSGNKDADPADGGI